ARPAPAPSPRCGRARSPTRVECRRRPAAAQPCPSPPGVAFAIMPDAARSPLTLLEPVAVSEIAINPSLHHVEVYTLKGLLTLLWHGPRDTPKVVITGGGGMGSLLGPAGGIYHSLGEQFARDDIATIRV